MKQIQQDKYNVAWFTLAECIARGEKIRALGVYRLLSHSIDNVAFARQLEGDIFMAFSDKEMAKNKYQEAAHLYRTSGKLKESAAINEHLHDLDPENINIVKNLIETYRQLHNNIKVIEHSIALFKLYVLKNSISQAEEILEELDTTTGIQNTAELHQHILFALIRDKNHSYDTAHKHLYAAIQGFANNSNTHLLQRLLSSLEALNTLYVHDARALLQHI